MPAQRDWRDYFERRHAYSRREHQQRAGVVGGFAGQAQRQYALSGAALAANLTTYVIGGKPSFIIAGSAGFTYTLQGSTNLLWWTSLLVTNSPTLPISWTDMTATNFTQRFYRVLFAP